MQLKAMCHYLCQFTCLIMKKKVNYNDLSFIKCVLNQGRTDVTVSCGLATFPKRM